MKKKILFSTYWYCECVRMLYLLEDDVDAFTETACVGSCQHGDGGFFTAHRVIGRSAIFYA